MTRRPRSLKQAQAQIAEQMRAQGQSWAQVGREFQQRFHVNARVALRQARGWTQPEAAERWTSKWPHDPKTFKSFSYWEAWPSATGYAPSLDVLDRLAQLYECSIADLVSDLDDYGALKQPAVSGVREPRERPALPAAASVGTAGAVGTAGVAGTVMRPRADANGSPNSAKLFGSLADLRAALPQFADLSSTALPDATSMPGFTRRKALLEMSSAFAVAAALPLLERTSATGEVGSVDRAVVTNTGLIVGGLRRQNAALGPGTTVQTGMALRAMMESVVKDAPSSVRNEAWVVYGDVAQLIGWMMFNLGEEATARYYYDDARKAAYQAGDFELASNVLAATAHLAMSQGDWPAAIDHAQAAEEAARHSGSTHARGYAADMAARVYAAAGQAGRCQAALDRERRMMAKIDWVDPPAERWGFYGPAFYWARESECALLLDMPVEASDAAMQAQDRFDPAYLHNNAMTLARKAEAQAKQGDVTGACRTLNEAGRLTTLVGSVRLSKQIARVRTELRPWETTAAVRELDSRLAHYRPTPAGQNSNPNSDSTTKAEV
jgi:tetratricopeptide (TPR) repeat protein